MAGRRHCTLVLVVLACLQLSQGIKLKFRYEECMMYEFAQYEPFYGSFVALVDLYNSQAHYDLTITSPSGRKVHETLGEAETKFHLVPYESGKYKFCLRLNQEKTGSRYVLSREVVWDLHVGLADTHSQESLKEHDTQSLWHYVNQVDAQLQQLRSTQQYLYWRERRHRMTVDSTKKRVLFYALLRSGALIAVSAIQVLAIRRMFSK